MNRFEALAGTEVVHLVRGRVRFRVQQGPLATGRLAQLKAACEGLPGIDEVHVRPASCSVIAVYDPDHHDQVLDAIGHLPADLHAPPAPAARRVNNTKRPRGGQPSGGRPGDGAANQAASTAHAGHHKPPSNKLSEITDTIEEEAEFLAEHSHAARALVDFARDVDTKLKLATNNNVDLKILFPIGLATVMVLEIGAAAATPMWVTLLLYSMNHFVELRAHDAADEEDEEQDAEAKVGEDAASLVT
jgi:hypothetical protein